MVVIVIKEYMKIYISVYTITYGSAIYIPNKLWHLNNTVWHSY